MSPHEEYKARLKVTEESNKSKSSGDCAPCRLKIAQDTFDMVAGGSRYLPTNEPLPGYFKSVEELCYPNHNNTDNRHLENAIDRLYGRKMPEYHPVDVISLMYGLVSPGGYIDDSDKPNEHRDLPGDIGVSFDPNTPEIYVFPCDRNKDGTYNYPNYYFYNNRLFELYIPNATKTLHSGRTFYCFFDFGEYQFYLVVSIEDNLNELIKCLWCSDNESKQRSCWEDFGKNCKDKVEDYIKNNVDKYYVDIILYKTNAWFIEPFLSAVKKDTEYFFCYSLSTR